MLILTCLAERLSIKPAKANYAINSMYVCQQNGRAPMGPAAVRPVGQRQANFQYKAGRGPAF